MRDYGLRVLVFGLALLALAVTVPLAWAQSENEYVSDVRLLSPADLIVNNDLYVKFGTSAPYQMRYNSGTPRLEVTDGTNVLWQLEDGGTTGNVTTTGNSTVTGDVAVNGGDLTSSASTFNLLNATATTLNMGGACTSLNFGGASGSFRFGNGAGSVNFFLSGAAGSERNLIFRSGTSARWRVVVDNSAESGSDAGSALAIRAYNDSAVLIDTPITIVRASAGAITIGGTSNRPTSFTGSVSAAGRIVASTITTFSANDTTPAVSAGNVFVIPGTWTAGNNITTFDGGTAGQKITIVGGDSDCVLNDAGALNLAGAFTAAAGDTIELITTDGTNWYELKRSDN
jgi:hypothetical protein